MTEVQDIHAVKGILKLAFDIAVPILIEAKKDGFQVTDLLAFLSSPEFREELGPSLKDISAVPAEISDLSLEEGFELVGFLMEETKVLVQALRA
jgi:hypothetical protein